MNSGNFESKNHSVGLSQYHLEWCPKYRYNALRSVHVKEFLVRTFTEIGGRFGILIHTTAIGNDHVHLFVSIPITMSVCKSVNLLKGTSSHRIFEEFPGFKKRYPKGHFWSRGYFFRSVSNITSGTVKKYIENQQHEKLHETMAAKQLKLEVFALN
ncbi:MAG: IS200/IS605 family transposase [Candidatus Micrarchaeales archaeon]